MRFGKQMGTGWFFKRDNASLDIISLRDESPKESDNFPGPDVLAQDIVEDLKATLGQFREIAMDLGQP